MDTDQLISHARARFDHAQARRVLREKYQAKLTFAYNGGMFRATPEMITFLSLYDTQEIVVLDLYENPIKVNAQELCNQIKLRWQEQMNAWFLEYEELGKKR